jgi:hypothetical protein
MRGIMTVEGGLADPGISAAALSTLKYVHDRQRDHHGE